MVAGNVLFATEGGGCGAPCRDSWGPPALLMRCLLFPCVGGARFRWDFHRFVFPRASTCEMRAGIGLFSTCTDFFLFGVLFNYWNIFVFWSRNHFSPTTSWLLFLVVISEIL